MMQLTYVELPGGRGGGVGKNSSKIIRDLNDDIRSEVVSRAMRYVDEYFSRNLLSTSSKFAFGAVQETF